MQTYNKVWYSRKLELTASDRKELSKIIYDEFQVSPNNATANCNTFKCQRIIKSEPCNYTYFFVEDKKVEEKSNNSTSTNQKAKTVQSKSGVKGRLMFRTLVGDHPSH
jgi:hypothetical protein